LEAPVEVPAGFPAAEFRKTVNEMADLYVGEGLSRDVAVTRASSYLSGYWAAAQRDKRAPVSVEMDAFEIRKLADRVDLGYEISQALDGLKEREAQIRIVQSLPMIRSRRDCLDAELRDALDKNEELYWFEAAAEELAARWDFMSEEERRRVAKSIVGRLVAEGLASDMASLGVKTKNE
jgi:hypothetical protein